VVIVEASSSDGVRHREAGAAAKRLGPSLSLPGQKGPPTRLGSPSRGLGRVGAAIESLGPSWGRHREAWAELGAPKRLGSPSRGLGRVGAAIESLGPSWGRHREAWAELGAPKRLVSPSRGLG
jgi:hypothetical protein